MKSYNRERSVSHEGTCLAALWQVPFDHLARYAVHDFRSFSRLCGGPYIPLSVDKAIRHLFDGSSPGHAGINPAASARRPRRHRVVNLRQQCTIWGRLIENTTAARPAAGKPDAYPGLRPVLSPPVDWDLIRRQYNEMVEYTTALRLATAAAADILRPFHPREFAAPQV